MPATSSTFTSWRRRGALRRHDDAWVAVFTGVGRAFMSGADLKTYVPEITKLSKQIQDGTATDVRGYSLSDGTDAVLRGSKIYKPIIAAVNGPCVAGGMEMLGGVDIRVASEHATFGVLEPARGLFAGGGTTVRLPRQVPFAHAMEFGFLLDSQRKLLSIGYRATDGTLDPSCYDLLASEARLASFVATKRSALEGLALDMRRPTGAIAHLARDLRDRGCEGGPQAFAEKRNRSGRAGRRAADVARAVIKTLLGAETGVLCARRSEMTITVRIPRPCEVGEGVVDVVQPDPAGDNRSRGSLPPRHSSSSIGKSRPGTTEPYWHPTNVFAFMKRS
jgi:enoyl-CoA hydratase